MADFTINRFGCSKKVFRDMVLTYVEKQLRWYCGPQVGRAHTREEIKGWLVELQETFNKLLQDPEATESSASTSRWLYANLKRQLEGAIKEHSEEAVET